MTDPVRVYREDYDRIRHSGFGIVSLIISILVGVYSLCPLAVAGIVEVNTTGGMSRESWVVAVIGLFLILGLGMSLLGIELGIVGLIQRDRKKVSPVLGLVFNLAAAVVLVGIMVIGVTR
jgi:hypothetical protein